MYGLFRALIREPFLLLLYYFIWPICSFSYLGTKLSRHFALITLFCEKFLQFFSSKILISKPDQISEIRSLFSFLARSNYTYTTLFLKRHQAVLHFQLPNDGLFFSRLVLEYFVISSGLLRLCWLKNVETASFLLRDLPLA